MKHTLTIFLLLVAAMAIGQSKTVTFDFSEVERNKKPEQYLYQIEKTLKYLEPDNSIQVPIEKAPCIVEFYAKKNRSIRRTGSFWISPGTTTVHLQGSLWKLSSTDRSENQRILDSLRSIRFKPELSNIRLAGSLPLLIHMNNNPNTYEFDYIEGVLDLTRDSFGDTHAHRNLTKHLQLQDKIDYHDGVLRSLSAIDRSGDTVRYTLSDEKYTLIDFSGSWCPSCLHSIPRLVEIHKQWQDKLNLITLWNDDSQEMYLNTAKKVKEKITWTSLRDPNGFVCKYFDVFSYPTFMLFGPDGTKVKEWKGRHPKGLDKLIKP